MVIFILKYRFPKETAASDKMAILQLFTRIIANILIEKGIDTIKEL